LHNFDFDKSIPTSFPTLTLAASAFRPVHFAELIFIAQRQTGRNSHCSLGKNEQNLLSTYTASMRFSGSRCLAGTQHDATFLTAGVLTPFLIARPVKDDSSTGKQA
jgi:hypothetical protein